MCLLTIQLATACGHDREIGTRVCQAAQRAHALRAERIRSGHQAESRSTNATCFSTLFGSSSSGSSAPAPCVQEMSVSVLYGFCEACEAAYREMGVHSVRSVSFVLRYWRFKNLRDWSHPMPAAWIPAFALFDPSAGGGGRGDVGGVGGGDDSGLLMRRELVMLAEKLRRFPAGRENGDRIFFAERLRQATLEWADAGSARGEGQGQGVQQQQQQPQQPSRRGHREPHEHPLYRDSAEFLRQWQKRAANVRDRGFTDMAAYREIMHPSPDQAAFYRWFREDFERVLDPKPLLQPAVFEDRVPPRLDIATWLRLTGALASVDEGGRSGRPEQQYRSQAPMIAALTEDVGPAVIFADSCSEPNGGGRSRQGKSSEGITPEMMAANLPTHLSFSSARAVVGRNAPAPYLKSPRDGELWFRRQSGRLFDSVPVERRTIVNTVLAATSPSNVAGSVPVGSLVSDSNDDDGVLRVASPLADEAAAAGTIRPRPQRRACDFIAYNSGWRRVDQEPEPAGDEKEQEADDDDEDNILYMTVQERHGAIKAGKSAAAVNETLGGRLVESISQVQLTIAEVPKEEEDDEHLSASEGLDAAGVPCVVLAQRRFTLDSDSDSSGSENGNDGDEKDKKRQQQNENVAESVLPVEEEDGAAAAIVLETKPETKAEGWIETEAENENKDEADTDAKEEEEEEDQGLVMMPSELAVFISPLAYKPYPLRPPSVDLPLDLQPAVLDACPYTHDGLVPLLEPKRWRVVKTGKVVAFRGMDDLDVVALHHLHDRDGWRPRSAQPLGAAQEGVWDGEWADEVKLGHELM